VAWRIISGEKAIALRGALSEKYEKKTCSADVVLRCCDGVQHIIKQRGA